MLNYCSGYQKWRIKFLIHSSAKLRLFHIYWIFCLLSLSSTTYVLE